MKTKQKNALGLASDLEKEQCRLCGVTRDGCGRLPDVRDLREHVCCVSVSVSGTPELVLIGVYILTFDIRIQNIYGDIDLDNTDKQ